MKQLLSKAAFQRMKVAQYDSIEVVKDMECPSCHRSDVNGTPPPDYAKPIGWCDTQSGHMAIFECPKCFTKFRCHINTNGRYDEFKFKIDFELIHFLYPKRTTKGGVTGQ